MPRLPKTAVLLVVAAAVATIPLAGCGASGGGDGGGASSVNAQPAPASPQLASAERPTAADFSAVKGRTLRQLADSVGGGPQFALATTAYTPGSNRLAFGMIGSDGDFIYGPTAIYLARKLNQRAIGPFMAPADSLQVRPAFRSRNSASDAGEVQAVYHAQVRLPGTGRWLVLAVTKDGGKLVGGAGAVNVTKTTPQPAVGSTAPRIHTPTLASVGGQASKIDTRLPPDQMHAVDLFDVLGKKPVMLLFATPALCQSRVCGPVTDVAAQLQTVYGSKVDFIHNEVYNDNNASDGLRPQMNAFHLTTEPWLFAIDRHGKIVERLEGAFGIDEFRAAVAKAQKE